MQRSISTPEKTRQSGTAGTLWLVQAISGLLLVLLLVLHMIAHHFVVEGGLRTFDDVVAYISNPAIFTIEIVFLFVVTIHALLGVRAIVMDLGPSKGREQIVNWVLAVAGIVTVVYGVWLLVTITFA
jgi:succinate dehydrogenase hydrophobic anchor subunit